MRLTSTTDISQLLYTYYSQLYKTRHPPTGQMLGDYLQDITMAQLEDGQREFLAAPIDAEEIKMAINALASGKAQGSDGLTGDFHKAYQDILAPQLIEV